jgi:LPS sulfotransferase NodH
MVGIETGYEGKFDFRQRAHGPELPYLLASVPRAGSTYFSHLLWRTGCLGAPLEYLNFLPLSPYGFASTSTELQQQLWRSILRRRCSPNGVFGLKVFTAQLQKLEQENPTLLQDVMALMLPRNRPRRIVYLRRRDRVAQAVSFTRAALTGVWRKEQEGTEQTPLEYSDERLEAAEREIAAQEEVWARMFADLRIDPLCVWHEDVLADPAAAVDQVADYLGVAIDPAAAVDVPAIEKQSEGEAPAWIERYSRSRQSSSRP